MTQVSSVFKILNLQHPNLRTQSWNLLVYTPSHRAHLLIDVEYGPLVSSVSLLVPTKL